MASRRTSTLSLTISLILSGASAAASAQDTAPESGAALEEIVVTSRRVQESLQETPISVSAFRAEDIERLGLTNIGDAAQFTPGFTTSAGPTGQSDGFFFIRGVGQVDLNPATDPGVGTYVDGVYLGRLMGASFDTMDIDRIEVLRGPQGTLFGRNTMGGAINVISHTPTGEFGGKLTVLGGDYNTYGVSGRIDFPVTETLAGTASAMYRTQDGWGERVSDGKTLPDAETSTGRVKFVWDPSESFTATVGADITRVRGTSQHQVLLAFNPAAFSPLGVPMVPQIQQYVTNNDRLFDNFSSGEPRFELDVQGANVTLEWSGTPVAVKSITAYRELEEFSTSDFDGSPYTFYDGFFDTDQDQFSQELQLSGDIAKAHWVLGGYYYEESAYHNNSISMGGNNGCLPFPAPPPPGGFAYPFCGASAYATPDVQRYLRNNQRIDVDIEAIAAFAHVKVDLSDRWSASLGLRWTEETKQQDYDFLLDNSRGVANLAGIPPIVLPTFSPRNPFLTVPTHYEQTWSEVTPSASVEFKPVDGIMLYASYAEGFKSGGFNGRPNPNQQGQFGVVSPYDPERLETYEVGVKSQFAQDRVRLNLALYSSKYEDIQLLVLGPSGFLDTENAAQSDIEGVEVELLALPVPALRLQAAVSYNDNEYSKLEPSTVTAGITADDRLPLTPEWTYSLGAEYVWDLTGGASFTAHADYSWRDDVYYGATNNAFEFQEAFGLLGVRAIYMFSNQRLSLTAYGRNLTDEKYLSNGQDVVGQLGVAFAGVGQPRMWGLEATYKFGAD